MRVYIDQGVDLPEISNLAALFSFEAVHVDHYEQKLKYIDPIPGTFILNISRLDGGDYLAGDDINDVEEIMQPHKPSDRFDIAHLYSAYHSGCQFFVTNNPKDFIREVRNNPASNGKREKLENILYGMKIVTLQELESELNNPPA